VLIEVSFLRFLASLAVRLDGRPVRIGHLERLDHVHGSQGSCDLIGGHLPLIVHFRIVPSTSHLPDCIVAKASRVVKPSKVKDGAGNAVSGSNLTEGSNPSIFAFHRIPCAYGRGPGRNCSFAKRLGGERLVPDRLETRKKI
jgi:hypothetical protein